MEKLFEKRFVIAFSSNRNSSLTRAPIRNPLVVPHQYYFVEAENSKEFDPAALISACS